MPASNDGRPAATVTSLTGSKLLEYPLLNKGTAFTQQERVELGLLGLLPPHVEVLESQVLRAYAALQQKSTDIERHIYLRALQDTNETLFYALVHTHTLRRSCR